MFAFGDPRLPERFWAKVRPDPVTGCWVWQGLADRDGYGFTQRVLKLEDGRWVRLAPHRWAYSALVGPLLTDTLNHRCRNKLCVNPAPEHAGDPMSYGENSRDAWRHTCRARWVRRCRCEACRARRLAAFRARSLAG